MHSRRLEEQSGGARAGERQINTAKYPIRRTDEYNVRCGKKQISKALATARRCVKKEQRPAAKVAAVLNPFMACTEVDGATGLEHEDLRGGVFSVMGDAYRREGNVELAAKWYRRACQLSAGDHVPIYMHIVCKHQLAEFYEDVLRILRDHNRRCEQKPAHVRFFLWLGMCLSREGRELRRSKKYNLEFLQKQTLPKAA